MTKTRTLNLITAALCLALAMVLPLLTGQIHSIGNMLCPIHIPVMICGLVCGRKYGAAVGFMAPLLRSFIFGMPALYPGAVAMAFECACYGFVIAVVHDHLRGKMRHMAVLYISLIKAMLAGRLVYGIARYVMLGIAGTQFNMKMFLTIEFVNSWPGMLLQLLIIPPIVRAIHRARGRASN